jgi:hypothetical protein
MTPDLPSPMHSIENRIFMIRGMAVMLDKDLAQIFQTETRILKQGVKRNIERFPAEFMFTLTEHEINGLVSQLVIPELKQLGGAAPFVFTEQGVAMLTTILKSDSAIKTSIQIIHAFVKMRKLISLEHGFSKRLEHIEIKQSEADQKIEKIFSALEKADTIPKQGIFYNGQIFDAYHFAADLIKRAKHSIILIDNYVDEVTLALLSKRNNKVEIIIYSGNANPMQETDFKKWTLQYGPIQFQTLKHNHDRFLIIDKQALYHLGASLKDLGHKLFAFSRMDQELERLMAVL